MFEQVSQHIFIRKYQHYTDRPNIGLIRGQRRALLFDAGNSEAHTLLLKQELEDAVELYNEYYKESPFVFISNKGVSLKEVVNTNKILLHIELHQGYIHISSVIDNLVKGASGQAVENMNLIFGLEQTMGLKLKPSAF